MAAFFFLSLIVVSFLTSETGAQQNYSGDSALNCTANDETGPSPAFLYTCNGQNHSCQAFLIFRSQPYFDSVHAISAFMSSDLEQLARLNGATMLSTFPLNKEVIVPVNCFCLNQYYYQANTTFYVTSKHGTYFVIATEAYEGLSTCASLLQENPQSQYELGIGLELQIPLRCACPTKNQTVSGIKYLLTYSIGYDDNIPDLAERFNTSAKSILDANGMEENQALYPETTILIPLSAKPTSSQTIIHKDPRNVLQSPNHRNMTPDLSAQPASSSGGKSSKRKLYLPVGLATASSLVVCSTILAIVFLQCKKRRIKLHGRGKDKRQVSVEDLRVEIASFDQALKVFGIKEIRKATENFSPKHRIKGSVYRGMFGGEVLAVKKMNRDVSMEVNILKKFNHFNLIKLHGVCENHGCFFLVFDYLETGSLRQWLSSDRSEEKGSWDMRIQIAIDIANGIHYLHSFTNPAYVHKDITSSNILLDGNMRAKITHFSLARASDRETASASLTKHVVGTRGYMAPEYIEAGQVTPMIDVYAFGVVLLELVTGKDAVFTQDGKQALLSKAVVAIMEKENAEVELFQYLDPSLIGGPGTEFALRLVKVSVACLTPEPARRPKMEEVVSTLMKILAELKISGTVDVASNDEPVPKWSQSVGVTYCKEDAASM